MLRWLEAVLLLDVLLALELVALLGIVEEVLLCMLELWLPILELELELELELGLNL